MSKQLYPRLRNLFAGYFHEFWEEEYDWGERKPYFEGVVKFYMKKNPEEMVAQAIQELEHLIKRNLNEDELFQVVHRELRAAIYPPGWGMTCQEWLEAVLRVLKKGEIDDAPDWK